MRAFHRFYRAEFVRCFGHIVGGKEFQHDLNLNEAASFQFLGHEIYLCHGFQSISRLPWFPLWGQAPSQAKSIPRSSYSRTLCGW